MSRPDVGGSSGGLQGTFSARGTASAQNTSFLNGVNVGDPAAIGAAGFYYDIDAFDDIQVSTGAHDITVPTSGVFLNMVTKTRRQQMGGRRDVHVAGRQHAGPKRSQSDAAEVRHSGRTAIRRISSRTPTSPLGGPLVQNKLRFFGAVPRLARPPERAGRRTRRSCWIRRTSRDGLGNFTWQLNQNNRLTGFYSRQRYSKPNRLLNSAAITVIDSTSDEEDMFDLAQGLWNSVIGKNFFLDARVGLNKILFPTYQNGGNQQSTTDNATGIVYGNFPTNTVRHRDRNQFNATGQYYRRSGAGRPARVQVRVRLHARCHA